MPVCRNVEGGLIALPGTLKYDSVPGAIHKKQKKQPSNSEFGTAACRREADAAGASRKVGRGWGHCCSPRLMQWGALLQMSRRCCLPLQEGEPLESSLTVYLFCPIHGYRGCVFPYVRACRGCHQRLDNQAAMIFQCHLSLLLLLACARCLGIGEFGLCCA